MNKKKKKSEMRRENERAAARQRQTERQMEGQDFRSFIRKKKKTQQMCICVGEVLPPQRHICFHDVPRL